MLSTPVNSSCLSQRQRAPAPVPAANYERKENECSNSAPLASPTGVNDFILLTASHESPSAKEKCSNDDKEICDGGVVAKEGSLPTPDIDITSGSDHQDVNVKLLKLNGDNIIDAVATGETCYESFNTTEEQSTGTPGTKKGQNDGEFDLVDIDLTPTKRAEITVTMLQQPLNSEATTYDTPPSGGGCSPGCHALYDVACELDLLPETDEKQRQQSTSDDMFCKLKASETIAAAKANTPKMQSILDEIVELSMIVESPDEEERDDITSTVEGMFLSGMAIMDSLFGNACTCFHVNPV